MDTITETKPQLTLPQLEGKSSLPEAVIPDLISCTYESLNLIDPKLAELLKKEPSYLAERSGSIGIDASLYFLQTAITRALRQPEFNHLPTNSQNASQQDALSTQTQTSQRLIHYRRMYEGSFAGEIHEHIKEHQFPAISKSLLKVLLFLDETKHQALLSDISLLNESLTPPQKLSKIAAAINAAITDHFITEEKNRQPVMTGDTITGTNGKKRSPTEKQIISIPRRGHPLGL